jgi:DNA-binding CsgD family transcriptional regulator/pimeloyl-ACP methyl ester carboxylesterase
MDAPAVQYVTTSDGYNIAYGVAGTGTTVIFLPTLFQHFSLFWSTVRGPALSALAERFQLVVYDGRGQGSSSRGLKASLTIEELELDLDAVVSRMDAPRFVLYGPSLFGQVAARYAAHSPERVAGLVLYNYVDSPQAAFAGGLRTLAGADWNYYIETTAKMSWSSYDPDLVIRLLPESTGQTDHVLLAETLRATSVEEVLGQIAVPTLVLATRIRPGEESGRRLAAGIRGAQLRLLDGNGFDPEGGKPPATVTAIGEFLHGLNLDAPMSAPDTLLSSREIEVLRLIAAGRSNAQIAEALVISPNTVGRHVSNIFDKVGAANRTEAAAYATRHGLA